MRASEIASYIAFRPCSGYPPSAPGVVSFSDAFVARLAVDGSALDFATLWGGTVPDTVWALTVDAAGDVYATGQTYSPDFPMTSGAYDSLFLGVPRSTDAFVLKLSVTSD